VGRCEGKSGPVELTVTSNVQFTWLKPYIWCLDRQKPQYIVLKSLKATPYRAVNDSCEHEQEKRRLLLLMCKNAQKARVRL